MNYMPECSVQMRDSVSKDNLSGSTKCLCALCTIKKIRENKISPQEQYTALVHVRIVICTGMGIYTGC